MDWCERSQSAGGAMPSSARALLTKGPQSPGAAPDSLKKPRGLSKRRRWGSLCSGWFFQYVALRLQQVPLGLQQLLVPPQLPVPQTRSFGISSTLLNKRLCFSRCFLSSLRLVWRQCLLHLIHWTATLHWPPVVECVENCRLWFTGGRFGDWIFYGILWAIIGFWVFVQL